MTHTSSRVSRRRVLKTAGVAAVGGGATALLALQQCWELESSVGTLATCSVGHPAGAMVQSPLQDERVY